jgi:hypothetical protein
MIIDYASIDEIWSNAVRGVQLVSDFLGIMYQFDRDNNRGNASRVFGFADITCLVLRGLCLFFF